MKYFLQTAVDAERFEEVPEAVFKDRKWAVDVDNNPRYTGNYFVVDGMDVNIHCDKIPVRLIGGINRMIGNGPQDSRNGIGDEPTHVNFKRGRSSWIFECATGQKYTKRAA